MRINVSAIVRRALFLFIGIYRMWLVWGFLFWLHWALRIGNPGNSKPFDFVYLLIDLKFYAIQLVASFLMPFIFVFIYFFRRYISLWELCTIAINCGLMFYFLLNFRT